MANIAIDTESIDTEILKRFMDFEMLIAFICGYYSLLYIPVIFQVASLLATLTHPGHIVIYAPGDSLPCRLDPS
ncbi:MULTISPECIES: hypothetical protein [Photorhabdus]|uniref:hypothetical protein n=1 Tax=Photorhabdus TaxID=29487 RepID=UPI000DCC356F|nr:hypothetical protein [Photorhabdus kayaii]MCT8350929.1 hypothetical protein [Photorhabdus kayaii]RAX12393.1 hypothetical protein CKY10_00730 [Photorhabdus sp. HUG-39]